MRSHVNLDWVRSPLSHQCTHSSSSVFRANQSFQLTRKCCYDSTATSVANCDKTSIRQNFVPDNATATKFQLRQHKFVSKIDNYKSVMDQRTTVFICMASSYTQNTTTIEQCRCEHPFVCAQNFRKGVPFTVTIDSKVALSPDGVAISAACNNVVVRYCTTEYSSIMIQNR